MRAKPALPYKFSHYCLLEPVYKAFPVNLQVESLLEYRRSQLLQVLKKHPVLVLVTGDTGKCVCAGTPLQDSHDFMFYKSKYTYGDGGKVIKETNEMDEKHLLWEFPSTLAVFRGGVLEVIIFIPNLFYLFHISNLF